MNACLGEFHVPVNADIHDLDVIFVDERDGMINPFGVKDLGEVGSVGSAVFHPTGRRIRDLPITIDKIID